MNNFIDFFGRDLYTLYICSRKTVSGNVRLPDYLFIYKIKVLCKSYLQVCVW